MKAAELREKSRDDLKSDLQDLLREQFNLRMQRGAGQAFDSAKMREGRKDIARIKTILTEKAAGEQR